MIIDPFKEIGENWVLITAGTKEKFNMMTASWGTMGVLWNKNIAMVFIRPTRYTKEFVDKEEYFTISFFGGEYKVPLTFCGKYSGRDVNKVEKCNLKPIFDKDVIYYQEATMVFKCKKIYQDSIKPSHFLDSKIAEFYPKKDYHEMYIGEIIEVIK